MLRSIISLALLVIIISCNSEQVQKKKVVIVDGANVFSDRKTYDSGKTYYVVVDTSCLMTLPSDKSSVLDRLNYRDSVILLQKTGPAFHYGALDNYWYKVSAGTEIGYIQSKDIFKYHLLEKSKMNKLDLARYLKQELNPSNYRIEKKLDSNSDEEYYYMIKGEDVESVYSLMRLLIMPDSFPKIPLDYKGNTITHGMCYAEVSAGLVPGEIKECTFHWSYPVDQDFLIMEQFPDTVKMKYILERD